VLELRGLTKRYGATLALDGADLTAAPGRLVGFLGPNGAGKTTTMRSVFGLVELDAGETLWHGRPITDADRPSFGYMPEQRGLYPEMRVGEQIAYFGQLHGLSRGEAVQAADRWLHELDLGDRSDDRVDALSHGNQQRVQLAVALVHDPELLVLDEPFSGLDPVGVERMKQIVRDAAHRGCSVVFSSHQLDLVEDLCDDVVVVRDGRIVLSGTLAEVRDADPRRRLTVGFADGVAATWAPPDDPTLGDVQVQERRDGAVRLLVPRDVALDRLLAAATEAGTVTRFAFEPQTLGQIFLEVVRR
jgi:ABC-2 type transport system ATP-binding protein